MPIRRHKLSMRYLYGILAVWRHSACARFAFLANRFQLTDYLLMQQYLVWSGAYAKSFNSTGPRWPAGA